MNQWINESMNKIIHRVAPRPWHCLKGKGHGKKCLGTIFLNIRWFGTYQNCLKCFKSFDLIKRGFIKISKVLGGGGDVQIFLGTNPNKRCIFPNLQFFNEWAKHDKTESQELGKSLCIKHIQDIQISLLVYIWSLCLVVKW